MTINVQQVRTELKNYLAEVGDVAESSAPALKLMRKAFRALEQEAPTTSSIELQTTSSLYVALAELNMLPEINGEPVADLAEALAASPLLLTDFEGRVAELASKDGSDSYSEEAEQFYTDFRHMIGANEDQKPAELIVWLEERGKYIDSLEGGLSNRDQTIQTLNQHILGWFLTATRRSDAPEDFGEVILLLSNVSARYVTYQEALASIGDYFSDDLRDGWTEKDLVAAVEKHFESVTRPSDREAQPDLRESLVTGIEAAALSYDDNHNKHGFMSIGGAEELLAIADLFPSLQDGFERNDVLEKVQDLVRRYAHLGTKADSMNKTISTIAHSFGYQADVSPLVLLGAVEKRAGNFASDGLALHIEDTRNMHNSSDASLGKTVVIKTVGNSDCWLDGRLLDLVHYVAGDLSERNRLAAKVARDIILELTDA